MPDLLLTHGYFLYEDPKERQILKPYVPLGFLYICSHLRKQGFDVEVFDTTFSSREELFSYLRETAPSVLGVYANLMTRSNVVEILQVAREAGWKTVVGGPEPGAYISEYLESGADVVVLGEGEITMQELLSAFREKRHEALDKVKGIAYLDENGNVHQTEPRAQIPDLDAQPWPARDAVDISRYVQTWRDAHGQGSVSIITARGCPYRCRWCSHQVFAHTHRRRSPKLVVDEVEWLLSRYAPDMMWVADDVFTIHHGWLYEYAAEMARAGTAHPLRMHFASRPAESKVVDTAGGTRVLPRLDWIGERVTTNSGLNGTWSPRRAGSVCRGDVPLARNSVGHVPDVGLRRRGVAGHRGDDRPCAPFRPRYFLHYCRLSHQGHAVLQGNRCEGRATG